MVGCDDGAISAHLVRGVGVGTNPGTEDADMMVGCDEPNTHWIQFHGRHARPEARALRGANPCPCPHRVATGTSRFRQHGTQDPAGFQRQQNGSVAEQGEPQESRVRAPADAVRAPTAQPPGQRGAGCGARRRTCCGREATLPQPGVDGHRKPPVLTRNGKRAMRDPPVKQQAPVSPSPAWA